MEGGLSQAERLYNLLSDGRPHRTDEILARVYGSAHCGIARIGARIWDIKKKYGVNIKCTPDDENKTLYWYRMEISAPASQQKPEIPASASLGSPRHPIYQKTVGAAKKAVLRPMERMQMSMF